MGIVSHGLYINMEIKNRGTPWRWSRGLLANIDLCRRAHLHQGAKPAPDFKTLPINVTFTNHVEFFSEDKDLMSSKKWI
jgi:hypothetical protein